MTISSRKPGHKGWSWHWAQPGAEASLAPGSENTWRQEWGQAPGHVFSGLLLISKVNLLLMCGYWCTRISMTSNATAGPQRPVRVGLKPRRKTWALSHVALAQGWFMNVGNLAIRWSSDGWSDLESAGVNLGVKSTIWPNSGKDDKYRGGSGSISSVKIITKDKS